MTAVVRLRGQLKTLAGDRAEHELDGASVADLLRALERSQPALAGWILDERGRVRRHINVFVNGEHEREDSAVAAGDKAKAADLFKSAQSVIDSVADKGLFHKNKAARHKSRLSAKVKALSAAA